MPATQLAASACLELLTPEGDAAGTLLSRREMGGDIDYTYLSL